MFFVCLFVLGFFVVVFYGGGGGVLNILLSFVDNAYNVVYICDFKQILHLL